MYGIYDMKNNEMCIGVFLSRKEVAKYFNTTSESIGATICRKEKNCIFYTPMWKGLL